MISPYTVTTPVDPFPPTVVDIETGPDGSVLGIGFGYCLNETGPQYKQFEGWAAFWDYYIQLFKKYRSKDARSRLSRVYAHNGANFDWLSLITWLKADDQLTDMNVIMSSAAAIGIKLFVPAIKRKITLMDSYQLLPGSLANLTKQFSVEHGKIDTESYKSRMNELKDENPDLFWEYLKNDVLGLQEVIVKFWQMIVELCGNIGALPMTLPALSLRLYRMMIKTPISTPWSNELRQFTRRAYRGGRVESYRKGYFEHVTAYDVNSMYPYVMRNMPVPASYRGAWTKKYRDDAMGIYEISFTQTNRAVPPVLYDETSNELAYVGTTVCTSADIECFKPYGVFEVARGFVFTDTAVLFQEFVDKFYGLRLAAQQAGNTALAYVCKILLNSLYGKFGQKPEGYKIVFLTPELLHDQSMTFIVPRGAEFAFVIEDAHIEHEFVAIAAFITAHARAALYHYIEQAPEDYVYCDTDSIHTTSLVPLPTGQELGQLKIEYQGSASYVGPKLYAHHDINKVKAKGISQKTAINPLTPDIMRQLATNQIRDYRVEFKRFPTIREVLFESAKPAVMLTRHRTIHANPLPRHDAAERSHIEDRVSRVGRSHRFLGP